MRLTKETARARYWQTEAGLYRATKPGEPAPAENGGGWPVLAELVKAKGDK